MKFWVIFTLISCSSAYSGEWTATGAGTHVRLNILPDKFEYSGPLVRASFRVETCNQHAVRQFEDNLHQLGLNAGTFDDKSELRLKRNGSSLGVSVSSPLAHALRGLDEQVVILRKTQELACKR
jgi:hypothetical protein